MFCKWCGLESETSDVCSWCRQPFSKSVATLTETASAPEEQAAAADTAPASAASASTARPLPGAVLLGGFDEFEDDLSPIPFSGPIRPSAPVVEPPRPPASPPSVREGPKAAPAPPAFAPTAPATPPTPPLEAIPIKRSEGEPPRPAVIPIAKPAAPPREPAPAAAPPVQPSPPPPLRPPPVSRPEAGPANRAPEAQPRPPAIPLGEPTPELRPAVGREVEAPAPLRPAAPLGAPAQPALQGRTATLVQPSVRTWYCRWCGLESETPQLCSWCHKDMSQLPAVQGRPLAIYSRRLGITRPAPHKQAPTPLVVPAPPVQPLAPSPDANGSKAAEAGVPEFGTFTAQKSLYYSDKVVDPISGAHYDADTGEADVIVEPRIITEDVDEPRQLAMNLCFLIVLSFAVAVMGRARPEMYLGLLGFSSFAAGISMPLFRTVPFGADDSEDLPMALALILLMGPFVGAILFAFWGILKQSVNPSMVGVFVTSLILRFSLDYVTEQPFIRVMPWNDYTLKTISAQFMPLVAILGLYAADMFKKPDE